MYHKRPGLFLETSAHIARLSGSRHVMAQVEELISRYAENGCRISTSDVVYREFISTLVKDFISVRNAIAREFLKRKRLQLTLAEIDVCLSGMQIFSVQRAKRLFVVKAAIDRRFAGLELIDTDKVIRFLDSSASDLAYRDFFRVGVAGAKKSIKKASEDYITEIECLAAAPLVTKKEPSKGCLCSAVGDRKACPGKTVGDVRLPQDWCFDEYTATTRCLSESEKCEITKFLKQHRERLVHLIRFAKNSSFSAKFRRKEKNKKSLELLHDLESWNGNSAAPLIGRKCAHYFTDILIFLQCPEDSRILSYDPDFDDLGEAIGVVNIRLDPKLPDRLMVS